MKAVSFRGEYTLKSAYTGSAKREINFDLNVNKDGYGTDNPIGAFVTVQANLREDIWLLASKPSEYSVSGSVAVITASNSDDTMQVYDINNCDDLEAFLHNVFNKYHTPPREAAPESETMDYKQPLLPSRRISNVRSEETFNDGCCAVIRSAFKCVI